ncbi:MAG TPA: LLM class flavin-dependent oxidoreductase [Thermomicrobiales bacterium]|nr:LLM class flavin-dependent oxidoreductase [Thermomicrobiales bacterium]
MIEQTPLLGINVDPGIGREEAAFARARIADQSGLDLLTVMDHPYNPRLHETWTLLTALALATERIHLGANVLTTPLRPPALLAKAAATLDVLSGGRLELGLGAGGYLDAIAGFGGGPQGSPAARYTAFKESLEIIRGLWASAGSAFSYAGAVHQVTNARFGPAPAHPIRIWTGALGPRMLRLTGQQADGLLVSSGYVAPEQLPEVNRLLDEGAAAAGRPPTAIRRGYNLMGVLDVGQSGARVRPGRSGMIVGDAATWIALVERLARDYRQDTFIFWPVAGDEEQQVEAFAREVAPAIRERLSRRL